MRVEENIHLININRWQVLPPVYYALTKQPPLGNPRAVFLYTKNFQAPLG
uniref:Uncharacterized protein n=1 Tax=Siphoviridae sp. ctf8W5 TaxID=2825595 RepID=A0A8S5Q6K2_9CAUD|nr:MAG TPA: hypothetical protein [Siphoviridae sp. ctf8W5]